MQVALFEQKSIRRTWHAGEWWFSVVDVVAVLTESINARDYWFKMKVRVGVEDRIELSTICRQFKMESPDKKMRLTDCANTPGLLRIIQSIPSPKAEPFKQWLARVGHERLQEIQDPELAMKRMRQLYAKKGYPKEWIEKRIRGIAVRQDLTAEWAQRDAKVGVEYSILTMLAEATTTKLHRDRDSRGFPELKADASDGGEVAGQTRKHIEKLSGKPVVSKKNFLDLPGGELIGGD